MVNPSIGSEKGPEKREQQGKESPRRGGSTFIQLLSQEVFPEHPVLWLHGENTVLLGHGHLEKREKKAGTSVGYNSQV